MIHIRKLLFFLLGTLLLASCTTKTNSPEDERPNFLFIAIDDLNVYNTVLGEEQGSFLKKVYPNDSLRNVIINRLTPNINKLANEGLTFNRAYCSAPLCGPSRTSLLTGVPPHVSGYYHHDKHFRAYPTLTKVTTLPQYLRLNGYYTAGIGKVFHKGKAYLDRGFFSDWPDQIYSWNDWVNGHSGTSSGPDSKIESFETISKYWPPKNKESLNFTRFGVTSLPAEKSNDYQNAVFIGKLITTGTAEKKDLSGELKKITVPEDKPYFLACGLFAPHLPWVVPQKFYDIFPQEEMSIDKELLEWVYNDLEDLDPKTKKRMLNSGFGKLIKHGIKIDGKGGDINAWKTAFQAYLATIAYADINVGVLLDALKNSPRKENTVVILWSDHGYHVGDKHKEGKTSLWEAANHCNFIIKDPRNSAISSGVNSNAPVTLQDIYPTIVSMAGLDRPAHVHGNNLNALLNNTDTAWTTPALSTNGEGNHTIRTKDYRYARYSSGAQELYNIAEDEFSYTNLAGKEAYAQVLEEMDTLLEEMLARKPGDFIR